MRGCDLRKIHATAQVSENAKIAADVTIGAFSIIYDNVHIEHGVHIGPSVILGEPHSAYYRSEEYENPPLMIGAGSLIRSGTVVYAGSTIGEGFQCGHHVVIREGTTIGAHCSAGTFCDIEGYCTLGDYVRLHSHVHLCQHTVVGNCVWLFPGVTVTNDLHPPSDEFRGAMIEDYAVVATGAVLLPGVRIGNSAVVGASALVRKDVPPHALVAQPPARVMGDVRQIILSEAGEPVYPWATRFKRGMPWEDTDFETWSREQGGRQHPIAPVRG
jgi:acetyltransferase-like isoleucine patch superfamily enzyme